MVTIVQLVRTPGCGPGGRGFESHWSPEEVAIPALRRDAGNAQFSSHSQKTFVDRIGSCGPGCRGEVYLDDVRREVLLVAQKQGKNQEEKWKIPPCSSPIFDF